MTMDLAQQIEQKALALQKPMNAVIDRGTSAVQQFYHGTTVFVTGGSGFVGKQLVEKILRSCRIKKLYMLLRQKKGTSIHQRLATILEDPVYDCLRKKQPLFADKIVPVEGDVADLRLGLSEKDWTTLTEEVNVIFHVAATVRFDEPLKKATLINVRGTREALTLGKHCKNLKCFNHTSTAFAHTTRSRINTDVEEKFYPSPIPPDAMIDMVETVDEDRLDAITPALIDDWPNTYTFTKALAEELIRTSAEDLTVCVVKPPVVLNAHIEPAPGWIDFKAGFSSPIGAIIGGGLGVLHTVLVNKEVTMSCAPVDYVNNAIMVASWDSAERKKRGDLELPIYTVSSSGCETKWKYFSEWLRSNEALKLCSPKAVWYSWVFETSNSFVYWLLMWLLHYIPGYLIDGLVDLLGVRPKGIPPLVKIYTRVYKLSKIYQFFSFNYWNIRDDNLKAMIQRMTPEDRVIYNCDVTTIDIREQSKRWCIGVRKYVVKDGLQGSDIAYNRQKYFFAYANALFMAVYGYVIYLVMYMIYSIFASIYQTLFY